MLRTKNREKDREIANCAGADDVSRKEWKNLGSSLRSLKQTGSDIDNFTESVVTSAMTAFKETNDTALIKACTAKISQACKHLPKEPKLYEFACDTESNLGKVSRKYGTHHVRLCKDFISI